MMSKWQPKTRDGRPVENVRPIDFDFGAWKLQGEVTYPDGERGTLTWTEDGHHVSHRRPSDSDLIPLEAPAEPPTDPDPRKALVQAARAYKRAQDALDAAVLANALASNAFDDAFQALGKPDLAFVVHVDGKTFVFGEDGEFSPVEVL